MNKEEHEALVNGIYAEYKELIKKLDKELKDFYQSFEKPLLLSDRLGNSITPGQLSVLRANEAYRTVRQDVIAGLRICTVWLGVNYNFSSEDVIIFKTIFFDKDGKKIYYEFYSSEEQALRGHFRSIAITEAVISATEARTKDSA